ncbi:MAG TPA: hypothetical protein VFF30_09340 [Nitrososphaerales archaeon]|nr:hypothetical protein [Nitrososphaerales archaeon]
MESVLAAEDEQLKKKPEEKFTGRAESAKQKRRTSKSEKKNNRDFSHCRSCMFLVLFVPLSSCPCSKAALLVEPLDGGRVNKI